MSDILYHYTSVETLYAILNNINNDVLTLRATHVNYLNDNTENEIAVQILKKNLLEYETELGIGNNGKIKKHLDDNISFFKNISFDKLPPFIFSLSEEKDSLPMWNTYADKSLGVTIGFDKNKIETEIENLSNARLLRCDYIHDEVENFIKENISYLYKSINISNYFVGILDDVEKLEWLAFEKMISFLKHSSYDYEKEWRVVMEPKFDWDAKDNFKDVNFNVVNGMPKPYIQFELKTNFIKEIVVGPSSDFNLVSKSIFMMLKKKGLDSTIIENVFNYPNNILITNSNCPFRKI